MSDVFDIFDDECKKVIEKVIDNWCVNAITMKLKKKHKHPRPKR